MSNILESIQRATHMGAVAERAKLVKFIDQLVVDVELMELTAPNEEAVKRLQGTRIGIAGVRLALEKLPYVSETLPYIESQPDLHRKNGHKHPTEPPLPPSL